MADGYWRYGDGRQPALPTLSGKRPRSDYDIPGGHELPGYFPRDDERGGHRIIRDTESIGASYDRYLRNGQISSFGGGESGRSLSGGLLGHPGDDPRMVGIGSLDPGIAGKSRSMGYEGGKPEISLPPDASNTLFVEGLPANCTRREVSHIFRPFVGFREVRLVSKESRHPGGEPLVLCFVDFGTPAQAATALDALQGGLLFISFTPLDKEKKTLLIRLVPSFLPPFNPVSSCSTITNTKKKKMPPRPAAAAAAQIQKRLPTKTSSSSSSPKPLITKTSESQNPPKLEISSNHRRQTFDLNEPFYNSSEEIDEVGETAQDKYEIVIKNKNKLNEVDVNESEEEEEEEEEVKEIEEDSKPKKETNKKQKEFEVFVGGIDRDAVEEDLKRVFNKVGEVVEVRLVRSKHSQKNKGFAFVRFATVDQAKRAASELNFTRVRGKVCEVTRNNDNETLHLGNICTTWTKDTLVEKLKSYELENLETVDLIDDPNEKGKNRGYAFLSFSTHMDAVAACSKLQKGHVFFGRTVRGDVAFAKSAVEPDEEVMAQVKSVFLDGLPVNWDEAKVHEQLKKYGEIENVQLAHSMPSARRKDFGFICFRTREAALACIDSVNKNGIGEGAHKVLLRATLRKPLKKRIPLMMGGWRGYSSKSYEHGTGYSYPNRPSRSIQSPGRDHDRRFVSRYSRRGDEYERELSPPVEKYGYHFRRGSVRQVPTRTNAHSRSRDPYFESSSSSRRSLANYQDLPTSYHRIPSHGRYVEDIYDPPLDYYEDSTAEDFDYPTSSRLKRPYSYVDDELLVSRSLTRRTRSRWSGLDVDDYPGHDASSYDEYSRNMLDDRISYESPVDASQYLSGSGASRSYYY